MLQTPQPSIESVFIKTETVSSEDSHFSEFQQTDTEEGLISQIETSKTEFIEQPTVPENNIAEVRGLAESHTSTAKRRAEETITSDSKHLRVTDIDSALEKLEQICDKVINITPQKEDSFDNFGKYVASLLRTCPSRTASQLQEDIIGLIMDGKNNSK